jgi:hypothetical protein
MTESDKKHPLALRIMVVVAVVLATIGIVIVVRRALNLTGYIETYVHPKYGAFDDSFTRYPFLTFIHIIPGGLFMLLAPLQFMPWIRNHKPRFHRFSGYVLLICGLLIGFTAIIMSFKLVIGGANETAATLVFAVLFLFALSKAFYYILHRNVALHREWMIRMFAIGLAIATIRPIVGMFFAISALSPQEFFGIAFWLGFIIHFIAAELWINYTREAKD